MRSWTIFAFCIAPLVASTNAHAERLFHPPRVTYADHVRAPEAATRVTAEQLVWHPTEAELTPPLLPSDKPQIVEPDGMYFGPMFIEGKYASAMKVIPEQFRRGASKPFGPTAIVVEQGGGVAVGGGGGPGVYGRF